MPGVTKVAVQFYIGMLLESSLSHAGQNRAHRPAAGRDCNHQTYKQFKYQHGIEIR